MKQLSTILISVFSTLHLYAQKTADRRVPFPATYVITTDTISHNTILPDSCWQMIADPSKKMTLEQVTQPGIFKDTIRKIDYRNNVFWFRYRIANAMQKEAKITLRVNTEYYRTQRSDLYIKTDSGKWNHLKTGHGVPWSERDGLKRMYYINVVIPSRGEITVYQKDKMNYFLYADKINYTLGSTFTGKTNVSFGFTDEIINNDYVNESFHYIPAVKSSFLLGLYALALVIYFYFFIIVREKEFLYFTLFLLSLVLSSLNSLDDVILREYPQVRSCIAIISAFFYYFALIFFIRYFLKTFLRFPRWDRWLVILAFVLVVFFLYSRMSYLFLTERPNFRPIVTLSILELVSISLLVTILLYIRSHDKIIRLMIFSVAPLICIWALFYLSEIVFETMLLGFHKSPPAFMQVWYQGSVLFEDTSFVWMVLIFSWVLFLRFSMLRKKLAMQEVEKEKERSAFIEQQKTKLEKQVAERTSELKQSLDNLKSTQSQLIQSEKMASLGELTAGIAHEIQNPLNFVNNFSDVNTELIDEANQEMVKGNVAEAKSILNDIKANEEKINHHGKRADAIVKSMLQHSRTSSGKKEPTDINALADEYLRLSYHGMRAKDKSFNCEMKTEFDESLQKINVVPQDIGRVLLNLFNNAFYACAERSRAETLEGLKNIQGLPYVPTVTVSTIYSPLPGEGVGGEAIITVIDNGNGIPSNIKDKIFQPFFTTKPTGSGTGLGLSLSYDIITKEHNGTIKAESEEGEGTKFIVMLPV